MKDIYKLLEDVGTLDDAFTVLKKEGIEISVNNKKIYLDVRDTIKTQEDYSLIESEKGFALIQHRTGNSWVIS